ncbi:TetR family transcriptional regulator [Actinobacteria bacterium YIM 96077]|uniref:TetR/AcrR family transcriptional regulator n=1 Tax=Phytoactinopolyspora halophila TaxID=1981511 RepID=A0A329QPU8_9ACTN|nr:TetR/AcrR family transcriptional regulator C-terminal domain-containing protein [Phytoactinopolyspora halophila]AYY15031.1 TetR family transcriptional regulator [Actinobacteria bacterium YIM 96077]RAW14203.1 TetR/AcrR family transcriptional regulator [Phytoactinopolyspora halophila]
MAERDYPDQEKVLALLFRAHDVPARRTGLSVGKIADAAIALADTSGLDGVSMRGLAHELGVGTMSLYNYISTKAELVPVMAERVIAELPEVEPSGGNWRAALERIADSYWHLYQRHPWLLEVPVTRPLLGPNGHRQAEAEFRVVDDIGLDEREMAAVIEAVHKHTAGAARRTLEIRRDAERSGMTDDQWWYTIAPSLAVHLSDMYLPVTERVGTAIGAPHTDPRYDFEFGLALLLDGLERLLTTRE